MLFIVQHLKKLERFRSFFKFCTQFWLVDKLNLSNHYNIFFAPKIAEQELGWWVEYKTFKILFLKRWSDIYQTQVLFKCCWKRPQMLDYKVLTSVGLYGSWGKNILSKSTSVGSMKFFDSQIHYMSLCLAINFKLSAECILLFLIQMWF